MRRRGRVEEAASHDRWLISYADFITLLFAFFVVLFASAYRDNQQIIKLARAIHTGFQSMGAFSGGADRTSTSKTSQASAAAQQAGMPREAASAASNIDVAELKRELTQAVGTELRDHEISMRLTPEGFVVSLTELGFFNSGRAALLPGAAGKIERIARVLSRHDLELRIEGHSDNRPIHNAQFQSNWQLSTARAMTVLMLLVHQCSYDPAKLSVAGYAQYQPIASNRTSEGRRENRRVDLVVLGSVPPRPLAP